MKIVVDDKIPFIREAVAQIADQVVYRPGKDICPEDVRDADALIVRTRTHCDATLLQGSKVSFIATATIGYDHLDTDFLKKAHIAWTNCPGCNAGSVGQYLRSCLLLLEKEKGYDLTQTTIGLVGVGHVGHAVIEAISPLGVRILLNDPPQEEALRQAGQATGAFLELEELQAQCDIISFHTPLILNGKHPTYHLADKHFFDKLARKPVIINTSRGSVIDNKGHQPGTATPYIYRHPAYRRIFRRWQSQRHANGTDSLVPPFPPSGQFPNPCPQTAPERHTFPLCT